MKEPVSFIRVIGVVGVTMMVWFAAVLFVLALGGG